MLIDDGLLRREDGRWTLADELAELPVPPTIHALLAARLERLPDEERALLARVVGRGHRRSTARRVRELAPARSRTSWTAASTALVRRDLIRPGPLELRRRRRLPLPPHPHPRRRVPLAAEGDARGAARALRRLGSSERARRALHEFEEIVGYHLEQAYRFLAELGPLDADADGACGARGRNGSSRPGAGRSRRSDRAGGGQPARARRRAGCRTTTPRRAALLPDLGAALIEAGRLAEAGDVLDGREPRGRGRRRRARRGARARPAPVPAPPARRGRPAPPRRPAVVERVIPVFPRGGDEQGLCSALRLRAWRHWIEAQAEAAAAAWEEAAAHARSAGAEHERIEILALDRLVAVLRPHARDRRHPALRGHPRRGRAATSRPPPTCCSRSPAPRDAGPLRRGARAAGHERRGLRGARTHSQLGRVAPRRDGRAARRRSRRRRAAACARATPRSRRWATERCSPRRRRSSGRRCSPRAATEEAEGLAELSAELAAGDDLITQVLWRGVRASVPRRRAAGSRRLSDSRARRSRSPSSTDFVNHSADALVDLGIVLGSAGRADDAQAALAQALDLYELKGNAVAARRVRADLAMPAPL